MRSEDEEQRLSGFSCFDTTCGTTGGGASSPPPPAPPPGAPTPGARPAAAAAASAASAASAAAAAVGGPLVRRGAAPLGPEGSSSARPLPGRPVI
jgi:hypothetical protein